MNLYTRIQSPRTDFLSCLRNSLSLRYAHSDWAEVVRLVSRSLVKPGFGQRTNTLTASRGRRVSSPPLGVHESRGRKENKLSSFTRTAQTPVYPCPTRSLISLKDLIHLCAGAVCSPLTTMHFQACTFPSLRLSSSVCAPFCLIFWTDIPKKSLDERIPLLY